METALPELDFRADARLCDRCGRCVADCPAKILALPPAEGPVQMVPDGAPKCYRCQHCLAICPPGAVSILGRDPRESLPLAGNLPAPRAMEALLRGRRSVRRYKAENVPADLLREIVAIASDAPTGRNCRSVRWTLIDDRAKLAAFREKLLQGIDELAAKGPLPPGLEGFAQYPRLWREEKTDILFRGAPHFVLTSAPRDAATPQVDGILALAYFELLAQSRGVGTVWDGLAYWALTELVPQAREWLGLPEGHVIGYCMAFGLPQIPFARTVHHAPPAPVHWV